MFSTDHSKSKFTAFDKLTLEVQLAAAAAAATAAAAAATAAVNAPSANRRGGGGSSKGNKGPQRVSTAAVKDHDRCEFFRRELDGDSGYATPVTASSPLPGQYLSEAAGEDLVKRLKPYFPGKDVQVGYYFASRIVVFVQHSAVQL